MKTNPVLHVCLHTSVRTKRSATGITTLSLVVQPLRSAVPMNVLRALLPAHVMHKTTCAITMPLIQNATIPVIVKSLLVFSHTTVPHV